MRRPAQPQHCRTGRRGDRSARPRESRRPVQGRAHQLAHDAVGRGVVVKRPTRMRNRLNPTERGYDGQHRALRGRLAITVASGRAVCWRCELVILPGCRRGIWDTMTTTEPSRGPEHRRCNRSAASKKHWQMYWAAKLRQPHRDPPDRNPPEPAKALSFFDAPHVRRH